MTQREPMPDIEVRLRHRRHELLSRYHDELARADAELASPESEEVERATDQWDARVLGMLGEADRRSLGEITAALERLDHGAYGMCIECGESIGRARLVALPEAATCIECATAAEVPVLRAAR
jgi:DnaK suppressor protein